MGQRAAGDAERVREGQRIGIARSRERPQRRLVHEGANRKVGEQKPPGFLPHELRRLAAEHALAAAEVRLEFVEGRLHLPPLMVEGGEFLGGGPVGLQDCRDQSIRGVGPRHVGQRVFNHAHGDGGSILARAERIPA